MGAWGVVVGGTTNQDGCRECVVISSHQITRIVALFGRMELGDSRPLQGGMMHSHEWD
jgi:hypothetical protein